jgi:DnaJ-domain-containing protein 1
MRRSRDFELSRHSIGGAVGISKRIFDLARANLNALLDQTGRDHTPVDQWSDEELEAELRRRRERRQREDRERRRRLAAEDEARRRATARNTSRGEQVRQKAQGERRTEARAAPPPSNERFRTLYAQLEVPNGAPFEEVKRGFRRLMRKYHPDLHAGNPTKHEAATKLTMALTQAYDELERHLKRGRG